MVLSFWLGLLLLTSTGKVGARTLDIRAQGSDKPRDLFDQVIHSLTVKYFPNYHTDSASPPLQWSIHPLPRSQIEERQFSPTNFSLTSSSDGTNQDADSGTVPTAPPVSLSGLSNGDGGGNANAVSVLAAAAAASASPTNGANGADTSATGSDRSAAQASATNSPLASSSASAISQSKPSASASSAPTSLSASASSSANPSSSPTSNTPASSSASSSSSAGPSPTKDAQQANKTDGQNASLLSSKNKMFPLIVAGLACAGLVAVMLLIAIARAIAHDQMRRDKLKKTYSFDSTSPCSSNLKDSFGNPLYPRGAKIGEKGEDKFTTAPGIGAARSLKRAMTRNKKQLGSFARRTQDGSVLIEVGDEVFAVPPHLADSYRERILRERRSRSDLSNGSASVDNLFGIKPKYLNDVGPDGDEEQARAAYDNMLDDNGARENGVGRSLSQRIGDRLRSLTTIASGGSGMEQQRPALIERNAYSFGIQHQLAGAIRQENLGSKAPVVTHGSEDWSIQQSSQELHKTPAILQGEGFGTAKVYQRSSSNQLPAAPTTIAVKPQNRKPPPKLLELNLLTEKLADLEKKSTSSSASHNGRGSRARPTQRERQGKLPKEASLTHSNAANTNSGSSTNGTFGGSTSTSEVSHANLPGTFPQRTKSLHQTNAKRVRSIKPLVLNIDDQPTISSRNDSGDSISSVGGYRGRQPDAYRSKTTVTRDEFKRNGREAGAELKRKTTTVALASPTRFIHEPNSTVIINPERPETAFRPLPIPPPFHLSKK
ncbi:uncharacterized protein MEPE_00944 [Melanopsichium pennsylvanicum]|uniref:Uncharacterized protein n=2 Tax=Melanopsichium pennsylvanicum TaxID=63383 RepID=A0AAJ4XJH1_9BASI|nr:uncharacterized protein MEPE_00944 [Melanopsichium pennsylvanicum]